jgi:hypothetical protein
MPALLAPQNWAVSLVQQQHGMALRLELAAFHFREQIGDGIGLGDAGVTQGLGLTTRLPSAENR